MGHAVTLQQGGIAFHVHEVVEDGANVTEACDVFQLVHVCLHLPLGCVDGVLFLLLGGKAGVLVLDVGNLLLVVASEAQFFGHLPVEGVELHLELVVADDLLGGGRFLQFVDAVLDLSLQQLSFLLIVLGVDEFYVGIRAFGFPQLGLTLPLELLKFNLILFLAAFIEGCETVGEVGVNP